MLAFGCDAKSGPLRKQRARRVWFGNGLDPLGRASSCKSRPPASTILILGLDGPVPVRVKKAAPDAREIPSPSAAFSLPRLLRPEMHANFLGEVRQLYVAEILCGGS